MLEKMSDWRMYIYIIWHNLNNNVILDTRIRIILKVDVIKATEFAGMIKRGFCNLYTVI